MARVHHVNIVVPPGRSGEVAAFYRDVLGLADAHRPASFTRPGAWLAFDDGAELHLSERDGSPHPDAHVAVEVDDVASVVGRLEATGAPWHEAEPITDGRRGFTRDPAGNRVEVLEHLR